MSYQFYKIMHFAGLALAIVGLGARIYLDDQSAKRKIALVHGLGMLLVLVGGFGLLARLGESLSGWVWLKVVFWLILGGSLTLAKRRIAPLGLMIGLGVLMALGAATAIYKPF